MVGKRDNFSEKTKRTLQERVDNRCSNPDCRCRTSFPNHDDGLTRIGEAAHITAAITGGPRFDPTLTNKQRKDISNGIWLCNICATKIDRDIGKYTVEILLEWKKRAEKSYEEELSNLKSENINVKGQIFHGDIFGGQFSGRDIINNNYEIKRKR